MKFSYTDVRLVPSGEISKELLKNDFQEDAATYCSKQKTTCNPMNDSRQKILNKHIFQTTQTYNQVNHFYNNTTDNETKQTNPTGHRNTTLNVSYTTENTSEKDICDNVIGSHEVSRHIQSDVQNITDTIAQLHS